MFLNVGSERSMGEECSYRFRVPQQPQLASSSSFFFSGPPTLKCFLCLSSHEMKKKNWLLRRKRWFSWNEFFSPFSSYSLKFRFLLSFDAVRSNQKRRWWGSIIDESSMKFSFLTARIEIDNNNDDHYTAFIAKNIIPFSTFTRRRQFLIRYLLLLSWLIITLWTFSRWLIEAVFCCRCWSSFERRPKRRMKIWEEWKTLVYYLWQLLMYSISFVLPS